MKLTKIIFLAFTVLCLSANTFAQLPENFPGITVINSGGAAEGNTFLTVSTDVDSIGYYVFLVDNEGEITNYRELENDYAYDFKMQPNGLLSYAQFIEHHSYTGGGNCYHVVMDQQMNELTTVQMKNGYVAEAHDFQILPNGHALMIGYYMTQMDLSEIVEDGYPDAKVSGGIIQELDDEGKVVFQWKSWDHYTPEEYPWGSRANRQTVSAFHLNTINLDIDGNIILATPGFSKKINRQTGEIMWHLGSNENEFSFIGIDSTQAVGNVTGHAIYRLENGNFLIYDNAGRGGTNTNSEVFEFHIDEENKTAELIWTYAYPEDIKAWHRGNAQRLPNGNTIIGWGGASGDTIPTCTEVDMDGNIIYEVYFDNPEVESYRAVKFPMGDWKVAEAWVAELALGNTYEFIQGDTLDTGIEVEITSITGGGYNDLIVATYDQAPKFPFFNGRDPMLTAQRVTMDPAYFYFGGIVYFDTEIFKLSNPEEITIYYRENEGEGTFVPLNTTYNYVTGKLAAEVELSGTQTCELVFGFNDLEAMAFAPVLTEPENDAVLYQEETQQLAWSPMGFFDYFELQVSTDQNFYSLVYDNDSLASTSIDFECGDNTTYYWRVKSFIIDYDTVLESEWSEIYTFTSGEALLTVTEPASEAKWQHGLEHFIQWDHNFSDDVVIELLTDTSFALIDTTENDGAYKWEIPVETPIDCRYRIRVSSASEPAITAVSPYFFSITDTAGNDGCTQSVEENSALSELRMYPVPVSGALEIDYILREYSYVNISISDIRGKKLKMLFSGNRGMGRNSHQLVLDEFENGVYLLQLQTETARLTRKIIVL